jgi:hypothetical protein
VTSSPIRACSVNPQSEGIGEKIEDFTPYKLKSWQTLKNTNARQAINPSHQTLKINGLSLFGAFVVAFCY